MGIIMNIVLHEPGIALNTGNIGRTCCATDTTLHLIEPMGFRIDAKEIKRAGMDYWEHLDVSTYINYADFKAKHPEAKIWYATTKAKRSYTEVSFSKDDFNRRHSYPSHPAHSQTNTTTQYIIFFTTLI